MEKKAEGKNRKLLWLIIGLVALVVVAVASIAVGKIFFTNKIPDLYWNVDREENTDPNTGLSIREPGEDGIYRIRFAHNGEHVELPVADKELVSTIDALDVMALTLDKDGFVTAVRAVESEAAVLCEKLYIQEITENAIILNSSVSMSGQKITVEITDYLRAYNVSGKGGFVGQELALQDLQAMDKISVYGVLEPKRADVIATHVFVIKQWEVGKVYWRTERLYDSKTKGTSRTPDENGVYTVSFYCDGEIVDLQFKNKAVVDVVDHAGTSSCYFGFEFDDDGYATKIQNAGKAAHMVMQCDRYDIVELNEDGSYVAEDALGGSGRKVQGVVSKDCAIYDISPVASAEGAMNRKVEGLKLHDRVYIWTDTVGNPVLIYVTARRADSPAYYNPKPQYDSSLGQTKRTPNADGYYEVQLLKAGETELQTYYVKDIKLINTIDSASDRFVGLKVKDGNIVEYVYGASSVFGNSYFCRGYTVTEASSTTVRVTSSTGKTVKDGYLDSNCKVWNVSATGRFGEETTLQAGDVIYAIQSPFGTLVNIYVTKRTQN